MTTGATAMRTARTTVRLLRRRLRAETGSMLIELMIALTFLTVAVGALLSVYTASAFSLQHTSIEGNALAMVDQRMEEFKTMPFSDLALNSATIPGATDAYVNSPPSSLTTAQRAGITSSQVTGGSAAATQLVTGPDKRVYRVDTYVYAATPPNGRGVVQLTVDARLVTNGVAGSIRAQVATAFDAASTTVPPA